MALLPSKSCLSNTTVWKRKKRKMNKRQRKKTQDNKKLVQYQELKRVFHQYWQIFLGLSAKDHYAQRTRPNSCINCNKATTEHGHDFIVYINGENKEKITMFRIFTTFTPACSTM